MVSDLFCAIKDAKEFVNKKIVENQSKILSKIAVDSTSFNRLIMKTALDLINEEDKRK